MEGKCQDIVWSKGEKCEARWSEDGQFYKGRITKLTRNDAGEVIATVQFDGYTEEESEDIDIKGLRKIVKKKTKHAEEADVSIIEDPDLQSTSMFKPLSGREEDTRLREKFSMWEEDDKDCNPRYAKEVKRQKGVVAVGGKAIPPGRKQTGGARGKSATTATPGLSDTSHSGCNTNKQASESPQPGCSDWPSPVVTKQCEVDLEELSEEEDLPEKEASFTDGFDDEDLEKPRFKFTPSSMKIPFCLSAPEETLVVQVPATINQYLRDYQRDGIKFLYTHYRSGGGAILGDDMGLGKTVQVIGLLAALLGKHGNKFDILRQKPKFIRQMSDNDNEMDGEDTQHRTFLIIGPGSVLYNWLDELEVWGYFSVGKYHAADKTHCLAETKKDKYEIVVTTFETYRDNMDDLNQVPWDAVFVDEVHKIKGLMSKITRALNCVRTRRRFGLTGTALQNNMLELWSILDWAQPGCLGTLDAFKFDFVDPIENGQKHDTTKRELALARKKKQEFARLRDKMLLRRTKKVIQDQLPKKDDNVVFCKLTPFQVAVYKAVQRHPGMKHVLSMDNPCSCGSGVVQGRCHNETEDGLSMRALNFTFMHFFLKIANHVALIIPSKTDNHLSDYSIKVTKEILGQFPQYLSDTREAAFRTLSDPKYCGKMKLSEIPKAVLHSIQFFLLLQGLLSVFSKDHSKVLLFSYSTKVLDILEQYMMSTGYEYRRLDGSTSVKKRMEIVREFNKDPDIFIFLVSTKAGGIGLNLTGANRVIVFDPNWNPTHDLQAQDRAYRIGQRRNVQVFRLVSAGCIEENMYLRQIYKQQLDSVAVGTLNAKRYFHAIAGDKQQKGELFGVKNMFQLRTGDTCLTMDIIQRNEKMESGLTGYQITKYIQPQVTEETREDNSDGEEDQIINDLDTSTESQEHDDNTRDMLADVFDMGELSPDEEMHKLSRNDSKTKKSPTEHGSLKQPHKAKSRTRKRSVGQRSASEVFDSVDGDHEAVPVGSTFSSVRDVLASSGVVHVHENRKVIGGSRAEDHMTKCAIQDVFERHHNTQIPAAECDPLSESSSSSEEEEEPPLKKSGRGQKDPNLPQAVVIGSTKVLIGQTPKTIRQQQFDKLARVKEVESLIELSSTSSNRRQLLKDFYCKDNPQLSVVFKDQDTQQPRTTKKLPKNPKIPNTLSGTRRKRLPTRPKPNPTLGVSFPDIQDSESFGTKTIVRSLSKDSDEGSLDIGKKITPKRMTTRSRKRRGRSQSKGIGATVGESLWNADSCSVSSTNTTEEEEEALVNKRQEESQDVGLLLEEIEQSKPTEIDFDDATNTSVLDDIFGNSKKDSKCLRRKPAPEKKRKKEMTLTKDCSSNKNDCLIIDSDSAETSMAGDSSASHLEESDLINESTLKDDSFDCFSDPQKWKKRRKKDHQEVDKLISESDDDFQKLFQTGKMKRKVKSERKRDVRVEITDDNVRSCDKTPSLF